MEGAWGRGPGRHWRRPRPRLRYRPPPHRSTEQCSGRSFLGIATLALVAVAFAIYVWQEEPGTSTRKRDLIESGTPFRADNPIGPGIPSRCSPIRAKGQAIRIPPGQAIRFNAYDPRTGEARLVFQAKESKPGR